MDPSEKEQLFYSFRNLQNLHLLNLHLQMKPFRV